MGIRVTKQPDVHVTEGELARYRREWQKACAYTVDPPTLEDFIRGQQRDER
jgi:hypothetical protein